MPVVSSLSVNPARTSTANVAQVQQASAMPSPPGMDLQRIAKALRTAAVEDNIAMTVLPGLLVASGVLECKTLILEGVDGQVLYGVDIADPACPLEPEHLGRNQLDQAVRIRLEPMRIGLVSKGEFRAIDLQGDAFFKVVIAAVVDCAPQIISDLQVLALRNELAEWVLLNEPLLSRIWEQVHPSVDEVKAQDWSINPASLLMRVGMLACVAASFGVFGGIGPLALGVWYFGMPLASAVHLARTGPDESREQLLLALASRLPGLDDPQLQILMNKLDARMGDLDVTTVVGNVRKLFAQRAPGVMGEELLERMDPGAWVRAAGKNLQRMPDLTPAKTAVGAGLELMVNLGVPCFVPGQMYKAGTVIPPGRQLTHVESREAKPDPRDATGAPLRMPQRTALEAPVNVLLPLAVAVVTDSPSTGLIAGLALAMTSGAQAAPVAQPEVVADKPELHAQTSPAHVNEARESLDKAINALKAQSRELSSNYVNYTALQRTASGVFPIAVSMLSNALISNKRFFELAKESTVQQRVYNRFRIEELESRIRALEREPSSAPMASDDVDTRSLQTAESRSATVLGSDEYIDAMLIKVMQQQRSGNVTIDASVLDQTVTVKVAPRGYKVSNAFVTEEKPYTVREVLLGKHYRTTTVIADVVPSQALRGHPVVPFLKDSTFSGKVAEQCSQDLAALKNDPLYRSNYESTARQRVRGVLTKYLLSSPAGYGHYLVRRWFSGHTHERLVQVDNRVVPHLLALWGKQGALLVSTATGQIYLWAVNDRSDELLRFTRLHLSQLDQQLVTDEQIIAQRFRVSNVDFFTPRLTFLQAHNPYSSLFTAEMAWLDSNLNSAVFTTDEQRANAKLRLEKGLMQFGAALASVALGVFTGGADIPLMLGVGLDLGTGLASLYFDSQLLAQADSAELVRRAEEDIYADKLALIVGAGLGGAAFARPILHTFEQVRTFCADLRQFARLMARQQTTQNAERLGVMTFLRASPRERSLMMAEIGFEPTAAQGTAAWQQVMHLQGSAGVLSSESVSASMRQGWREAFLGSEARQVHTAEDLLALPRGHRVAVVRESDAELVHGSLSLGEGKVSGPGRQAMATEASSNGWRSVDLGEQLTFTEDGIHLQGQRVRVYADASVAEFRGEPLLGPGRAAMTAAEVEAQRSYLHDLPVNNLRAKAKYCRQAINYLQGHGFGDIKVRVMSAWRGERKIVQYVAVGTAPNGRRMVFDLKPALPGKWGNEVLDGSMALPEELWVGAYQKANGWTVKYREFSTFKDAKAFAQKVRGMSPVSYQEGAVLIKAPADYRQVTGRFWQPKGELLEAPPVIDKKYAEHLHQWKFATGVRKTEYELGKKQPVAIPGLPANTQRWSSTELKNWYLRHQAQLTDLHKGAIAQRIDSAVYRETVMKNLLRAGNRFKQFNVQGNAVYRAAPQALVVGTGEGRCLGLVKAMAVALDDGAQNNLVDRLFLFAAEPEAAESVMFKRGVVALNHDALPSRSMTHVSLDGVCTRMKAMPATGYFELGTENHAMLVGKRISQGQAKYYFYDPNTGLVEFERFSDFEALFKHYFADAKLNAAYQVYGSAKAPQFELNSINVAEQSKARLNSRLTTADLSRKTPLIPQAAA